MGWISHGMEFVRPFRSTAYIDYLKHFKELCQRSLDGSRQGVVLSSDLSSAYNGRVIRLQAPKYVALDKALEQLHAEERYLRHQLIVRFEERLADRLSETRKRKHALQLFGAQLRHQKGLVRQDFAGMEDALDRATRDLESIPPHPNGFEAMQERIVLQKEHAGLFRALQSIKNPSCIVETAPGEPIVESGKSVPTKSKSKNKNKTLEEDTDAGQKKFDRIKGKALDKVIQHTYPLNKFPFKTPEQCEASFSKSKSYSISREEAVRVIREDPDLLKHFPDLSKISKKELCQRIFKLSKGWTV